MNSTCKICNNTAHIIDEKEYFCAGCMMKIIRQQISRNSKPVLKKSITKKTN
jgi:hypothetical protein